jgi:tetratricopeptide (TPR) repeat protein
VVSALYLGFIGSERAPMTVTEREVMAWESVTSDPESPVTAEQWQSYVLALVADGQLQRAQQVINRVNADATIDQSQGAHMLYGEGVLRSTEGRHEDALAAFTAAMEAAVEAYEEELARGDAEGPNWAMAMGLHPNYYRSALERAVIYREQARWSEGIEMLDIYLEGNPQSAGVLVDRAYLKIQVDDLDGAEADYRQALRYVPDFQEALDGLQQIGVGE